MTRLLLGGIGGSVSGISSVVPRQTSQSNTGAILIRQHHSSAFLRDWFSPNCKRPSAVTSRTQTQAQNSRSLEDDQCDWAIVLYSRSPRNAPWNPQRRACKNGILIPSKKKDTIP